MNTRKTQLTNDQHYHIFNRSIAKFVIFNNDDDYLRMKEMLNLYRFADFNYKYSKFIILDANHQSAIIHDITKKNDLLVEIVAYSLMPTHIHLVLKQVADGGITKFMGKISNSYTRYFNIKHHRKGPLWEDHFRNVLVSRDEQMLHLTRYIHLNASSAGLVENPSDWPYSSLKEYTDQDDYGFCDFKDVIDIVPAKYKKFVLDYKDYQRQISLIKTILIDDYSG